MKKEVYKIGQEVEITEDFEFEILSGKKVKVLNGDKAILNSRGYIKYINGNAKGVMQKADCDLRGYDNFNIANMIYKRLEGTYKISDFLENEDISINDFIEEIEDLLLDIL